MTNTSALADIIAELERADAGSFYLDRLIGRERLFPDWRDRVGKDEVPTGDAGLVRDARAGDFIPDKPLAYTVQIDAALTLIPKGWCWDAGSGGGTYIHGPWARIYPNDHRGQSAGTGNQNAATTALAMCIAALKAREIAHAK